MSKKVIILMTLKPNKVGKESSNPAESGIFSWANLIYGDALEASFQPLEPTVYIAVASSLSKGLDLVLALEEYILEEQLEVKASYAINNTTVDDLNLLLQGSTNERSFQATIDMVARMKKDRRKFLVFASGDTQINKMLRIIQHFIDSWNPKDRQTVSGFLQGRDYKEMAQIEGKDESSLWRRHKSLAIEEYLASKDVLMYLIKE